MDQNNQLIFSPFSLIFDKEYIKEEYNKIYQPKEIANNIGHYVKLFYQYNVETKNGYRPHHFYALQISGISRALLQELVRHDDLLGITIKSTRYTLKELKSEKPFINLDNMKYDFGRALNYCILTDIKNINECILQGLENLRLSLLEGYSNDKVKYQLPEAYRTEGFLTYNKLNLDNLLKLRISKDALWEFQELAFLIKKLLNN